MSSLSNSITTRVKATYVQLGRSSGSSHCHTAFPSLADSDSVCVTTWWDLQQRVCSGFSPDSLLICDTSRRDPRSTKFSAAKLLLFFIKQIIQLFFQKNLLTLLALTITERTRYVDIGSMGIDERQEQGDLRRAKSPSGMRL